jgi:hypothetical protein
MCETNIEETFDIWSGTLQNHGRWLETVVGLANTRKRMHELAAQSPGPYFIFNPWNGCVLDEVDTQQQHFVALSAKAGK